MPTPSQRDSRIISLHCDWITRNGSSRVTVEHRRANLLRLADALPCDLLDATHDVLDQWQAHLGRMTSSRGRALSANSIASYTGHARAFFAWAVQVGHIEHNPTERLPRPRKTPGQAHPVPEGDVALVLAVASEPLRTWLVLAAFMGLRAAEIAHIRRSDIDEVRGRLILSGVGKGAKPFRLVVPKHVEPSLRLHMHATGQLWRTPTGCPLTPGSVSRLVSQFFRRQEMPYTLHWLRHSFGSQMYAQTRDLLLTQDVMRHTSPDTTRIYVETNNAAGTAAMDRLAKRALDKRERNGGPPPEGGAASAA